MRDERMPQVMGSHFRLFLARYLSPANPGLLVSRLDGFVHWGFAELISGYEPRPDRRCLHCLGSLFFLGLELDLDDIGNLRMQWQICARGGQPPFFGAKGVSPDICETQSVTESGQH